MSVVRPFAAVALLSAALAAPLAAQSPPLVLPRESQGASVSQVVGLTEIRVSYHRPAVKGRTVWGGVVPFDSVWRAGANENTVLAVSSPFSVGGRRLDAGRYGLHMIPTPSRWTVIVSRQADAWGSYRYDQAEDALRFQVTPREAPMVEHLQYTLDDPTDGAVTLTLRWEKLAVSFPISVETDRVVLDSLATQLRGIPQFFPDGWGNAAGWALQHDHLPEADAWADSALRIRRGYDGLSIKAAVLERQGDSAGAAALRTESYAVANEAQLNAAGYRLLRQKRVAEALALFQRNAKQHPESWNVYDSLAEAYALKGERKPAVANYRKARTMAPDPNERARIDRAIAALQ